MIFKHSIGIILVCLVISASAFGQSKDTLVQNFKYKGVPIHPKLVMEFIPWVSDDKPITVSVDIAAAFGTNEYYAGAVRDEKGYVSFKDENDDFTYKWLGELDNGIQVVSTYNYMTGGSGEFQDLLFIKFHNQDFELDGKSYNQVIMTLVKYYVLGDRVHPEITILQDKVIVDKPRDADKEVVIQF